MSCQLAQRIMVGLDICYIGSAEIIRDISYRPPEGLFVDFFTITALFIDITGTIGKSIGGQILTQLKDFEGCRLISCRRGVFSFFFYKSTLLAC